MAVEVILDTVEGSGVQLDGMTASKIRGGIATGLSGDPSSALEKSLDGLIAAGVPLGHVITVNGTALYFRRLQVEASASDTAVLRLLYDNSGLPETAYIIRTRSFLQPFSTYLVPGTNEPLRVDWVNPDDAGDPVPEDAVTFNILQPVLEVAVSGVKLGTHPPTIYEEAVGSVSDSDWRGRPRGAWLVTEAGSELSKYKGLFAWNVTASTRPGRDWRECGTLYNHKTGRYVKVDDADYASLLSDGYMEGIITKVNGALSWGPYPTTSFPALFGF